MFPALGIFMCFVIVLGEVGPKTPPALWGVNSDEKPNSSCYFVDPPIYLDIGLLVVVCGVVGWFFVSLVWRQSTIPRTYTHTTETHIADCIVGAPLYLN